MEVQPVPKTLFFVGQVVAARDAQVSSMRGGRLESYTVEVGQWVTAGSTLATLSANELVFASEAALAMQTQARARIAGASDPDSVPSVRAARARAEIAEDAFRRSEQLHAQGSTSDQDLARARTERDSARAELETAASEALASFGRLRELRAMAGQARAALNERDVRAPFDGIVVERFVDVGQSVAPNAPVVRVVDPSDVRVRIDVPQFEAQVVRLGMKAWTRVGEHRIEAEVVRSTPGLVGAARARMVEAKLALGEISLESVLFGAQVPVWLELPEEESLIEVPRRATLESAGVFRAWIVREGRLEERLLTIARFEGDRVWVRSGLAAGEALVLSPQADFKLGEAVGQ